MSRRGLVVALIVAAAACGRDPLSKARQLEALGRYPSAIELYQAYAEQHSKDERAAEALFRIAEIHHHVLKDYPRARDQYQKIARRHERSPWAERAKAAYFSCPDYFPLAELERKFGDSQSKGEYMVTEEKMSAVAGGETRWLLKRQILAGAQLVSNSSRLYERKLGELREYELGRNEYSIVLKSPLVKGDKWQTLRDGKKTFYTVEDDAVRVKTEAGDFSGCLKLKIATEGLEGTWKVEIYAPDVGPVMVAAASAEGETPISELLEYRRVEPDAKKKTLKDRIRPLYLKLKQKLSKSPIETSEPAAPEKKPAER